MRVSLACASSTCSSIESSLFSSCAPYSRKLLILESSVFSSCAPYSRKLLILESSLFSSCAPYSRKLLILVHIFNKHMYTPEERVHTHIHTWPWSSMKPYAYIHPRIHTHLHTYTDTHNKYIQACIRSPHRYMHTWTTPDACHQPRPWRHQHQGQTTHRCHGSLL
jgi:hypothetical protein